MGPSRLVFLSLYLASSLLAVVNGECNNMCSGHGLCGANDMCTCYRNWQGNDCSQRTCPYDVAFIDTAQGDLNHDGKVDMSVVNTQAHDSAFEMYSVDFVAGEAHALMECSNKGLCDRSTGECACFDGYEGSACQRTVCFNKCSGHGVCRTIDDFSHSLDPLQRVAYNLWDRTKNRACMCDPGYGDYDCSKRLCPRDADPLKAHVSYETQRIALGSTVGSFHLVYTDYYYEEFETSLIVVDNGATTAANIEQALTSIPNGVIPYVDVVCPSPIQCDVTFSGNAGQLILMKAVIPPQSTMSTVDVSTYQAGTNVNEECSGRGLCDYETGICKCFRGYAGYACNLQYPRREVRKITAPPPSSDPSGPDPEPEVPPCTTEACFVYSSGGISGGYQDNESITQTLSCPDTYLVSLMLWTVEVERNYDFLRFYEGSDSSGVALFNSRDLPSSSDNPSKTALSPSGQWILSASNSIYMTFTSDVSAVYGGYSMSWYCTIPCGPNSWLPVGGRTCTLDCSDCPPGSDCSSGIRMLCPVGTASPGGCVGCSPCAAGLYATGSGFSSCVPCPSGTWSEAYTGDPSSDCKAVSTCPPGFDCSSGAKVDCAALGMVSRGRGEACHSCETGYLCSNGLISECDMGKYTVDGVNCITCDTPGYFAIQMQMIKSLQAIGQTQANSFPGTSDMCRDCSSDNIYAFAGFANGCYYSGTIPDVSQYLIATTLTCPSNTLVSVSTLGATLRYSSEIRFKDPSTGNFIAEFGNWISTSPPRAISGGTLTMLTSVNFEASRSFSGYATDDFHFLWTCLTTDCAASNQWTQTPGTCNDCSLCPAGHSCANGVITLCTPGYYSSGGTCDACSQCEAGSKCDDYGLSSISACPANTWSDPGSSTCTALNRCPPGSSCLTGARLPCDSGSFSAGGSDECHIGCVSGYICNGGTISECPLGQYTVDGSTCVTCAVGQQALQMAVFEHLLQNGLIDASVVGTSDMCRDCSTDACLLKSTRGLITRGYVSNGDWLVTGMDLTCPTGNQVSIKLERSSGSYVTFSEGAASIPFSLLLENWALGSLLRLMPITTDPVRFVGAVVPDDGGWFDLTWQCVSNTCTAPSWYNDGVCSDCAECPEGYSCTDSVVNACPLGTQYVAGAGGCDHQCVDCEAGWYGYGVFYPCMQCPFYKWSDAGEGDCKDAGDCPTGFSCDTGVRVAV